MVTAVLHKSFKIKLDKVDTLQYPNFTPSDIDYYLNLGKDRLIKTRYSGINSKSQSFEQSQKRIDDLRTLVNKKSYNLVNTDYVSNEKYYQINETKLNVTDFFVAIKDYLSYSDTKCNTQFNREIKYIPHDKFGAILSDPFHAPEFDYPVKLVTDNFIELYFGKQVDLTRFNITYHFTYLKLPIAISSSNATYTELPEHLADEIVNESVICALEHIEQPRQKTFNRELLTQE